jgi:hypothetical protein
MGADLMYAGEDHKNRNFWKLYTDMKKIAVALKGHQDLSDDLAMMELLDKVEAMARESLHRNAFDESDERLE